jgi:RHS repeat-associated protein
MHLKRTHRSCKKGNRPDAADRLSQIKYSKSDATLIDQIDYTYDAAGQRISKSMQNGSSSPETPMSATFDAGNRMQTITLNPSKPEQKIYTLSYDNNGNLTKKQLSTDTNCTTDCTEYVWDSRNRLTQIKQNQTTSATYSYDAENRRIQTNITNNGTTNQVSYIYAGSQSVGEVRNQQLSHSLMTGLQMDEHIARIALNQGATPQVKTYLTDALGSVIANAKADQSLELGYAFSLYGQTQKAGVESEAAGSENPSQYTGRENDNNGLYFYRARYYDPVLKRFISEDPIGLAGGDNFFAYVNGNPISLTDPTGLQAYMCGAAGLPAWCPPPPPPPPPPPKYLCCSKEKMAACSLPTGVAKNCLKCALSLLSKKPDKSACQKCGQSTASSVVCACTYSETPCDPPPPPAPICEPSSPE